MTLRYREDSAADVEGDPVHACEKAVALGLEGHDPIQHEISHLKLDGSRAEVWLDGGDLAGVMVLRLVEDGGSWLIDEVVME